MNARRAIFILGTAVIFLVGAVVAISLFFISKLDSEKKQLQTLKARENRWPKVENNFQSPKVDNPHQVSAEDESKNNEENKGVV